jgi:hypothetical protein
MMAEILNYLENSALIANIISFVVLGFAGVLVRSIIRGIGKLAEDREALEKQAGLALQLRAIATITYQSTLMYKNAVINSNLSPEAKQEALKTFEEVKKAYEALLPKLEVGEGEEPVKSPAVKEMVAELEQIGQDALSKLRQQLK